MLKLRLMVSNRIIPILLLLLVPLVSFTNANAATGSLCAYLLSRFSPQNSNSDIDDFINADEIVTTILRAHALPPAIPPENPFRRLLISARAPGRTLHYVQNVGQDIPDTPIVLTLPQAGSQTVWQALTPRARILLARQLQTTFKRGTYVNESGNSVQAAINWGSLILLRSDFSNYTPGLSPARYLRAAQQGAPSGFCRHANAALIGLLAELGFPPAHLRLVRGQKTGTSDTGHLWGELFDPTTGLWIELDATPNSMTMESQLFRMLRDDGGAERSVPNRTRYPVLQEDIIASFLEPRPPQSISIGFGLGIPD